MVSKAKPNPEYMAQHEKDFGPAGSLQPITQKKDWTGGLSAESLSALSDLSLRINDRIEKHAKSSIKAMIDVGQLLLTARDMFAGDNEFGKWRMANTHLQSRQDAHRCMTIAQGYADKKLTNDMIDKLPASTLVEVLNSPAKVADEIQQRLEGGEKVKRSEVIEARKEAEKPKEKAAPPLVSAGSSGLKPAMPVSKPINHDKLIQETIDNPSVLKRIEIVMDDEFPDLDQITKSAIVLGVDPAPSYPMSGPNLLACFDRCMEQVEDEKQKIILNNCYSQVSRHYRDIRN